MQPGSAQAVHLLSEAGRLAYADRGPVHRRPDFVAVPAQGLIDPAYLKSRAALITAEKAMGTSGPGRPPASRTRLWGGDTSPELASTTHIAIVDAAGNAVSMTTTIEAAFGSRLMVRGFLLNNQLTDFSFAPEQAGKPVANRLERKATAEFHVADAGPAPDGRLLMVVGSAGGSAIINHVAKTLVAVMDWGLGIQQAIELPNMGSRGGPTEIEREFRLGRSRPPWSPWGTRWWPSKSRAVCRESW